MARGASQNWPEDLAARAHITANWVEPFSDRRQEIVFIGVGMNETDLRHKLNACLLTPAKMRSGSKAWARLPDPFPKWESS